MKKGNYAMEKDNPVQYVVVEDDHYHSAKKYLYIFPFQKFKVDQTNQKNITLTIRLI